MTHARARAMSCQRWGRRVPRIETKALHRSSTAAARLTHTGSHTVYGATVRAAPAINPRKGSRGRVSRALASAMMERQLLQAPLAMGKAFAEGHGHPGQLEPIVQALLLGKKHPAREARQPGFDAHVLGQAEPVEPELGGGAPGEELGDEDIA